MARRPAAGFLLIEALAALTIAAIGLSALIRFQIEVQRAGVLAAQRFDALAVASMQLESLQAAIHAGDISAAGGVDAVDLGPDGEPLSSGIVYTREWRLTPADGIIWIDVSTAWATGNGETHRILLSSAATADAARDSGNLAARAAFIGLP